MVKILLKNFLWGLLRYSGLCAVVRFYNRHHLLVITYHGVLNQPQGSHLNRNCVSVAMLTRQIAFLRRHYRLLTLREAIDGLAGRTALPPYSCLITFDDGFRNNYELALPVLRAAGAPAVVFVTTGMLDEPGTLPWIEDVSLRIIRGHGTRLDLHSNGVYFHFELRSPSERLRACEQVRTYLKSATSAERARLVKEIKKQCPLPEHELQIERFGFLTWSEARALVADGVEIGSHTIRHHPLATLTDDELHAEIAISKQTIETQIGRPCIAMSYPDGTRESFGGREQRALRAVGYECAFSQIPGYNRQRNDLFSLHRFNVPGGDADFLTFIATLTGARALFGRLGRRGTG